MPTLEEILNLPQGAVWLKADLHVHTPASSDIGDQWVNASPEDVVRIAIEKQLDIIAITDHNTVAWCDVVREASINTTLTVFPGVEISTHQGHVLGIFDVDTPASKIEDLLIQLGITREQFGSLEAATAKGIVEVCTAIEQAGGVAIAAHVDGERGFLKVIKVKSVALELLRFGLDQMPRVLKIQQEVTSLLSQQLGDLGTVHIVLRKGDIYYLVERTWGMPPAPPVVRRLSQEGIEQIEGELDMQLFFPIKAFSQSEIIEFAREPEVRLSLTDDLIDCTKENAKVKFENLASNFLGKEGVDKVIDIVLNLDKADNIGVLTQELGEVVKKG